MSEITWNETLKSQIDRLANAILGDNGEHPAWQGESLGACDLAIKIMRMDKEEIRRLRAENAGLKQSLEDVSEQLINSDTALARIVCEDQ